VCSAPSSTPGAHLDQDGWSDAITCLAVALQQSKNPLHAPPVHSINMLRCAITNRTLFPGDDARQQAALVRQTALWAQQGIDLIQLREKDLPSATLATLARRILQAIEGTPTRLLINSRPDVALAVAAHGVHLTSAPGELTPTQVRQLFQQSGASKPAITISCHTISSILTAKNHQPDAILFSPIFEKNIADKTIPGQGLARLHEACQAAAPIPIYALGGITQTNSTQCQEAGAAGIAAIRLFHQTLSNEGS
jgi:thiamine-phosphate pyrophosphorylase